MARQGDRTARTTIHYGAKPPKRKAWLAAGYVRAERLTATFPAEALPSVALIESVTRREDGDVLIVKLWATRLSEDEQFGASLVAGSVPVGTARLVKRTEALDGLARWKARGKLHVVRAAS